MVGRKIQKDRFADDWDQRDYPAVASYLFVPLRYAMYARVYCDEKEPMDIQTTEIHPDSCLVLSLVVLLS